MEIKVKFKILSIYPRSQIIRWFAVRTHGVWLILDNGEYMYVNVFSPRFYDKKQFLEIVSGEVKQKLFRRIRFMDRVLKSRLETFDNYHERKIAMENSYSYAGLEAEVTLEA